MTKYEGNLSSIYVSMCMFLYGSTSDSHFSYFLLDSKVSISLLWNHKFKLFCYTSILNNALF